MFKKLEYAGAWLAAWGFYYIGHVVSLPMSCFDIDVYALYNWCMVKSCNIDDKYQIGVWQLVEPVEPVDEGDDKLVED